jgi:hypothetical protein
VAKFKHPATVLRHRKDLEAVREVGIERVDSSNSEALFACLSFFVNRKTAIDTLTRSSNELDGAQGKKGVRSAQEVCKWNACYMAKEKQALL